MQRTSPFTKREKDPEHQQAVMQAVAHAVMLYSTEIKKDGKAYWAWTTEERELWRTHVTKKYKKIMNVGRVLAKQRVRDIEQRYGLVLI